MIAINFIRDIDGVPRAHAAAPFEELGFYLQDNVQSPRACAELLRFLQQIRSGERTSWQGTGNVHTLTLTPDTATIRNEFTEPPETCELSLDAFEQALREWRNLLLEGCNLP